MTLFSPFVSPTITKTASAVTSNNALAFEEDEEEKPAAADPWNSDLVDLLLPNGKLQLDRAQIKEGGEISG